MNFNFILPFDVDALTSYISSANEESILMSGEKELSMTYKARWNRARRARLKIEDPEKYAVQLAVDRNYQAIKNSDPEQKAKNAARAREWRRLNPEKAAALDAKRSERRKKALQAGAPQESVRKFLTGHYDRKEYARGYYQRNREKQIAAAKAWQKANPERAAAILARSRPVTKWEGYYPLSTLNPVCEACGTNIAGAKAAHGDHCHDTGRFRGWLCRECNLALGHVQDSIDRLHKLIAYLERTSVF